MFCESIGFALDAPVSYQVVTTTNPLVLMVRFDLGSPMQGKKFMLIWNLLQKFASANATILEGRAEKEGRHMTVRFIMRERLGLPRVKHPAG